MDVKLLNTTNDLTEFRHGILLYNTECREVIGPHRIDFDQDS
jgi:hypothetical protein